jgi:hypothetical protein
MCHHPYRRPQAHHIARRQATRKAHGVRAHFRLGSRGRLIRHPSRLCFHIHLRTLACLFDALTRIVHVSIFRALCHVIRYNSVLFYLLSSLKLNFAWMREVVLFPRGAASISTSCRLPNACVSGVRSTYPPRCFVLPSLNEISGGRLQGIIFSGR